MAATGQKTTEILETKQCWEVMELWFSQSEEVILTPEHAAKTTKKTCLGHNDHVLEEDLL